MLDNHVLERRGELRIQGVDLGEILGKIIRIVIVMDCNARGLLGPKIDIEIHAHLAQQRRALAARRRARRHRLFAGTRLGTLRSGVLLLLLLLLVLLTVVMKWLLLLFAPRRPADARLALDCASLLQRGGASTCECFIIVVVVIAGCRGRWCGCRSRRCTIVAATGRSGRIRDLLSRHFIILQIQL